VAYIVRPHRASCIMASGHHTVVYDPSGAYGEPSRKVPPHNSPHMPWNGHVLWPQASSPCNGKCVDVLPPFILLLLNMMLRSSRLFPHKPSSHASSLDIQRVSTTSVRRAMFLFPVPENHVIRKETLCFISSFCAPQLTFHVPPPPCSSRILLVSYC
jgi:hypothetical protein